MSLFIIITPLFDRMHKTTLIHLRLILMQGKKAEAVLAGPCYKVLYLFCHTVNYIRYIEQSFSFPILPQCELHICNTVDYTLQNKN